MPGKKFTFGFVLSAAMNSSFAARRASRGMSSRTLRKAPRRGSRAGWRSAPVCQDVYFDALPAFFMYKDGIK